MLKEAAEAGFYQPPGLIDKYPRIQILSIADLLTGKKIEYPKFAADATYKKAPKARKAAEEQIPLTGAERRPVLANCGRTTDIRAAVEERSFRAALAETTGL